MEIKQSRDEQVAEYSKKFEAETAERLSKLFKLKVKPESIKWLGDQRQQKEFAWTYVRAFKWYNLLMYTDYGAVGMFPLLNFVEITRTKKILFFWTKKEKEWEMFSNITDFYRLLKENMPTEFETFNKLIAADQV